jgi:hypothetical protein
MFEVKIGKKVDVRINSCFISNLTEKKLRYLNCK